MKYANDVYSGSYGTVYLFMLYNLTVLHIWHTMNMDMVHMEIWPCTEHSPMHLSLSQFRA